MPASEAFKARLRQAFTEIQPGQTYTFRRTFTEGDLTAFCGISGDFNPIHLDDGFAAESWYGRRTVPGLLTASMATHIGGMLGWLATEMSFEFLAPVYVGDTIQCVFTVEERDEAARRLRGTAMYTNSSGQEVLRARVSGFPSHVRLRPDPTP